VELKEFLKALLDPEMFGWAVSEEVRKEAKRQLEAYEDHDRD
jgi:hypothetical protein